MGLFSQIAFPVSSPIAENGIEMLTKSTAPSERIAAIKSNTRIGHGLNAKLLFGFGF
jgi:hypothetical protein